MFTQPFLLIKSVLSGWLLWQCDEISIDYAKIIAFKTIIMTLSSNYLIDYTCSLNAF